MMKLRTVLLLAAGIAIGHRLAKQSSEDDPYVVKGPRDEQRSGNPALRLITGQAQKLADQAAVKGIDAIRGARRAIQSRLGEDDDDAAWN
jgi:hypothetical protein